MDDLHKLAAKYFRDYRGFDWPENEEGFELKAKQRRESGRYTLEEAAFFVASFGKASAISIMIRIERAVGERTLPVYRPGLNSVYESYLMRAWEDEAYWDDLNNWLEKNERRIGPIFPNPLNTQGASENEVKSASTNESATRVVRFRRNTLDPLIDEAIKRAKCKELADVYNELKKMALEEAGPFKGTFEGSAFCYTDEHGTDRKLSRNALGKRLAKRRAGRL